MPNPFKTDRKISARQLATLISSSVFALLLSTPPLPAQGQMPAQAQPPEKKANIQAAPPFTLAQATEQPPATTQPSPPASSAPTSSAPADQLARLDAAALTLDKAGTPESRISTLRRLAEAYGEIGEPARAIQLLDQAVLTAEQITEPTAESTAPDDNANEPTTATEFAMAQQAEREAEPSALAQRYVRALTRIAPDYSRLGKTTTAQNLLEQATETALTLTGEYRSGGSELGKIAKAYTLIEDAEVTEKGLLTILELVTDFEGPAWENSNAPFIPSGMVDSFAQLDNATLANEGLSRLFEMKLTLSKASTTEASTTEASTTEASTTENRSEGLSIRTLSQFAIAHSQQNNADTAEALIAQAMETIRNSAIGIEELRTITIIANACGHLNDTATSAQKLAELRQMVQTAELFPDQGDLSEEEALRAAYRDFAYQASPLASIAIAYSKLGNQPKAQETLAPMVEGIPVSASSIPELEQLAGLYKVIGDVPGQQAVLQTVFDLLPQLKEGASLGLNIADVTPGYLGITSLLRGYMETEEDAIAQTRLIALEDFFKEVRFAEQGFSGQLSNLAAAAIVRGDEATAHRLMIEAMEIVATPADQLIPDDPRFNATRRSGENFEQNQSVSVLSSLARNYGEMQNEPIKAEGFATIRQTAASKIEEAERRADIDDVITRAYAGI